MYDQPVLPYGGDNNPNSGHAGSSTSRERAERDDAAGTTGARQRGVLALASSAAARGITVSEVRTRLDLHHGQASAALSNLHKAGYLARLVTVRERCKVYVLPEHVSGRQTEAHASTSTTQLLLDMAGELRSFAPCMFHLAVDAERNPGCRGCRVTILLNRYDNRGGSHG